MDTQIVNALDHLTKLKKLTSDLKMDDFADSYDVILNSIPKLNKEELKQVLFNMLTILNNDNNGPIFMKQISIDINGISAEDNLLSINEFTALLASVSKHFLVNADKWIGEVYYFGYILYAIRQDYPLSEIRDGLLQTSLEDVKYFLEICRLIYDPIDDWREATEKIDDIIKLIQDDVLPKFSLS